MAILKSTIVNGSLTISDNDISINVGKSIQTLNSTADVLSKFKDSHTTWYKAQLTTTNSKTVNVYRIGPICALSIQYIYTPAKGLTQNFISLPIGFRPPNLVRQSFSTIASNNINNHVTISIDPNGAISAITQSSVATEFYCYPVWITANAYPDSKYTWTP